MARFNYKQVIYAGMVSIAAADERVTKFEKKHINEVFDRYLKATHKEKKEVLKIWEYNKDAFTDILIEELLVFSKRDQIEAFSYIMKYINWSKYKYDFSKQTKSKGVDEERAEFSLYHDKAKLIMQRLDFTQKEYEYQTRTTKR